MTSLTELKYLESHIFGINAAYLVTQTYIVDFTCVVFHRQFAIHRMPRSRTYSAHWIEVEQGDREWYSRGTYQIINVKTVFKRL